MICNSSSQLRHGSLRGDVNFCMQKFLSIGRIGIFLQIYFAVNSLVILFTIPVESVCRGMHEHRVGQPALDPAPVGTVTGRAPVF